MRKSLLWLWIAAIALATGALGASTFAVSPRAEIDVVTLEGTIRPATVRVFASRLDRAIERRPRFIVVEIGDLGGSDVEAGRALVAALRRVPRELRTGAFVVGRVEGAGLLAPFP